MYEVSEKWLTRVMPHALVSVRVDLSRGSTAAAGRRMILRSLSPGNDLVAARATAEPTTLRRCVKDSSDGAADSDLRPAARGPVRRRRFPFAPGGYYYHHYEYIDIQFDYSCYGYSNNYSYC